MATWHLEIFVPFLPCGCKPDQNLDPKTADFQNTLLEVKEKYKDKLVLQIYSLNQHLSHFRKYPEIVTVLQDTGKRGLPVLVCNGNLVFQGSFPTREELENILTQ